MIDFDLDTYILNGDTVEDGYLQPCQTVKRGKPEWRTEPGLKFTPKVLQVHPCDFFWIVNKDNPLIAFEKSVAYHLSHTYAKFDELQSKVENDLSFFSVKMLWEMTNHRNNQWKDTVLLYLKNGINPGWLE